MSATKTSISWIDTTWNPLRGCSRVSSGCEHCYAESQAGRFSGPGQPYEGLVRKTSQGWKWTGDVKIIEKDLEVPLHWKNPRRIFVNSMSDLFHERVTDQWLLMIFDVMRRCPRHTFQILTKRPERMANICQRLRFDPDYLDRRPRHLSLQYRTPGNGVMWLADSADGPGYRLMGGKGCTGMTWVWMGVSCENQATADERIPWLLQTPAAVHFLSCEPLIESTDLREWLHGEHRDAGECEKWIQGDFVDFCAHTPLHWIIVGGESGSKARPCNMAWIRSIVQQCQQAQVPCFVKQLGAWPYSKEDREDHFLLRNRKGADPSEWPNDLQVQQFPSSEKEEWTQLV